MFSRGGSYELELISAHWRGANHFGWTSWRWSGGAVKLAVLPYFHRRVRSCVKPQLNDLIIHIFVASFSLHTCWNHHCQDNCKLPAKCVVCKPHLIHFPIWIIWPFLNNSLTFRFLLFNMNVERDTEHHFDVISKWNVIWWPLFLCVNGQIGLLTKTNLFCLSFRICVWSSCY